MDWAISGIGIVVRVMMTHKVRAAWILSGINNVLFSVVAIQNGLWGLLPLSVMQAGLSVYGWKKWR